jgi:uncharacterized protein YuzE
MSSVSAYTRDCLWQGFRRRRSSCSRQPRQGDVPAVADLRVTYDSTASAAYVYVTDPLVRAKSSRMYPCDPAGADGMINVDFDEQGRLIGIEVLAASSKLPEYLLESSERLDAGDT